MSLGRHPFAIAFLLSVGILLGGAGKAFAAAEVTRLAQTQSGPADASAPAAPANPQLPSAEPVGNVATVSGSASVTRDNATTVLQVRDDIFAGDVVETGANSSLGITFDDSTTFNLSASAKITIDDYVYKEGGKLNAALFDVAKGTVAFVAAAVAKTGNMRITTPTATLGIRGTTGLIEIPQGAAANASNVAVKLYPDPDGAVGRIEINDRGGAQLGTLTQGSTGFAIRPGAGGRRFSAVPLLISPQQALRDQGFVRQVHAAQGLGRRIVTEQRAFRRANPGLSNPNRGPRPVQPQRQNGLPGPNRTAPPQPGPQNRPGQPEVPGRQQLQQPGAPLPAIAPPAGRQQRQIPGIQRQDRIKQSAPGLQNLPPRQPRRLPPPPKSDRKKRPG